MSLDQPSGLLDQRDVEWCRDCDGMRPGEWIARPGSAFPVFRCDACQGETGSEG